MLGSSFEGALRSSGGQTVVEPRDKPAEGVTECHALEFLAEINGIRGRGGLGLQRRSEW